MASELKAAAQWQAEPLRLQDKSDTGRRSAESARYGQTNRTGDKMAPDWELDNVW